MKKFVDDFGGWSILFFIVGAVIVAAGFIVISVRQSSTNLDLEGFKVEKRDTIIQRTEGDPRSSIKMIEFSDFQCPYCKLFHEELIPQIRKEFIDTNIASLEYYPMTFLGVDSVNATKAAICAQDQDQFWAYHDLLFYIQSPDRNNGTYSKDNLFELAEYIDNEISYFDQKLFSDCFESGEVTNYVNQLQKQAADFGIQSTPTLVINNIAVAGVQDIDVYKQIVEKILSENK
ncbi:MAG: DsbA family protein [Dehalococcoidia bacterium]|tara:strand:- start:272 stop:967 length:696 start_codon:yes stop_codon:yes gene_type:complete